MMHDQIEIRLTNRHHFGLVRQSYAHLRALLPLERPEQLFKALEHLLENVIEHAYDDIEAIEVTVRFTITPRQLQIDVEDSGMPFDFTPFLQESVDGSTRHDKVFFHIYDLVDRFWFTMLENRGKRFSIIQSFTQNYNVAAAEPCKKVPDRETILERMVVRRFEDGDAEGIAQLIYRNYRYTYFKTQFYDPAKTRSLNAEGKVISIVAVYGIRVVGHFALIISDGSNVAEIGIAAVDPEFKKMGIMNRMFGQIILTAETIGLNAFYGEAIMLHPYSQKANLSHAMCESAIVLGEVPSNMEIEKRLSVSQRSGSMISFKVFKRPPRYLNPPARYAGQIEKFYACAGIARTASKPPCPKRDALKQHVDEHNNVGVIVVESLPDPEAFDERIDLLQTDHCDMLYADVNLHHIDAIDELVTMLNRRRFFYSGVLYSYYHDEDYLRLQRKNSREVEEEQLVCYSRNARAMLQYIMEDEAAVNAQA